MGEDVLGNEILENFNGKGLRYWVERVSFPTGIVEVTLDGEGIPCYEIKQGVAWITCRILRNLIDWLVRLVEECGNSYNVEPIFGGHVRGGI